ncbi:hypothetical protein HMPREF1318_3010 [Actinomyces massiliensis F0489]|uniref:Uncharacterized protein n=1 Tax=Actinomyces massiliensis F0489 TaxID=1125718 RepID=J0MUC0_9ACTO|nr:hypothetical protein HMPREF1318_3010 [Actinomyces massiliensis F0489]
MVPQVLSRLGGAPGGPPVAAVGTGPMVHEVGRFGRIRR